MQRREPKLVENAKTTAFVRGASANQTVRDVLHELVGPTSLLMTLLLISSSTIITVTATRYALLAAPPEASLRRQLLRPVRITFWLYFHLNLSLRVYTRYLCAHHMQEARLSAVRGSHATGIRLQFVSVPLLRVHFSSSCDTM